LRLPCVGFFQPSFGSSFRRALLARGQRCNRSVDVRCHRIRELFRDDARQLALIRNYQSQQARKQLLVRLSVKQPFSYFEMVHEKRLQFLAH
jgi:hypothetical protein